jgi:hypothetical protein
MMSNTIDQQFVEFVVKSLVGNPDAVSIARSVDDKGVLLELTVDPEDLGRVIGKRGATAQSLRTLLRALGTKNEARYNLKIVDNGVFPDRKQGDDSSVASPSNDDTASVAPVAVADDEPEEFETASEVESDVVAKTRAELDDLDDLDI